MSDSGVTSLSRPKLGTSQSAVEPNRDEGVHTDTLSFGRPGTVSVSTGVSSKYGFLSGAAKLRSPKDINVIFSIIKESVYLFGIRETFSHLLHVLGGLPEKFIIIAVQSVDEKTNKFSYNLFRNKIKKIVPVFNLLVDLAESESSLDKNFASQLPIILPSNPSVGSSSFDFDSIMFEGGLTRVLNFINDTYVAAMYAQDPIVTDEITKVMREIKKSKLPTESPPESESEPESEPEPEIESGDQPDPTDSEQNRVVSPIPPPQRFKWY